MLLRVFRRILQHFLFGGAPYDMCASGRWINLGALNDFPHDRTSLFSQDLLVSDRCQNLVNECANDREILRTLEERVNGRLQSSLAMDAIMGCPRRRNGTKLGIFRDVNVPPFRVSRGLARYALSGKDID